jgi:hypothetical protein
LGRAIAIFVGEHAPVEETAEGRLEGHE